MNIGLERVRGNLAPKAEYYSDLPPLPNYQSINLLMSEETWWITQYGRNGEQRFVPREVVETLVVRKDGKPKKQKAFAVFIWQRFQAIKRDYGVNPVGVRRKQKGQLWDEGFVRVFLGSLAQLENEEGKADVRRETAYTLRRNIERAELLKAFLANL